MLSVTWKTVAPHPQVPDRRASERFPVQLELHYTQCGRSGKSEVAFGKTINLSSNGLLLSATTPLTVGKRVSLSINWPAKLDAKCGLQLVAMGRVVRCHGTQVAIEIERHEFKTRRLTAPASKDEPARH